MESIHSIWVQTLTEAPEDDPVDTILAHGTSLLFEEYRHRQTVTQKVKDATIVAIADQVGAKVAEEVAKAGLSQMHQYVSADDLIPISTRFSSAMSAELLAFACRFSREYLKVKGEFFLDAQVLLRIHFPFAVARKASKGYGPELLEPGRLSEANRKRVEAKMRYFRGLPYAAFTHGPHIDTWAGHSYDGINLWWAIEGVEEWNTVLMYPEIVGNEGITHLGEPFYIAPGNPLPKPLKFAVSDGAVLAFNGDLLHATQLNISEVTRVSISIRVNPYAPEFDQNISRHVSLWHCSSDIENDIFDKPIEFPKRPHKPKDASIVRNLVPPREHQKIAIDRAFPAAGECLPVMNSEQLSIGERVTIKFSNREIVVYRTDKGVFATAAECPHLGIKLIDGFCDGETVYCPGHGVTFDLKTGVSRCELLTLRTFPLIEESGRICFAGKSTNDPSSQLTDNNASDRTAA